MKDRIKIFIFISILSVFLGLEYFSGNLDRHQSGKDPFVKIRKHNLENPKLINTPDFNKQNFDVQSIELKTFPNKLNINTERKEVLELLPSVGPRRAEKIVAYREVHGKIKNLEELSKIQSMNQKVVNNIKKFIIFN